MPARRRDLFVTVRTEGGILPADLLQRIALGDAEGLRAEDYHLSGERLSEAITRSWNRLLAAWASFRTALERLPESDAATSITRERWLLPLFQELGYGRLVAVRGIEVDGRAFPVSHLWHHAPIHLVGARVDLDRRTARVAGAATTSPHGLVQELLNRSKDHLWGFVSNGLRLRVLRDNASLTRHPYVEFDVEALMAGEVYADFALLWLLCHQSRFEAERPENCWLEKWSQAAQRQGTRVLDDLRRGVEQAIQALGRGFLAHPANTEVRDRLRSGALAAQDYYRQLLRTVYRLLFLFVAEDRGLLLDPKADTAAKERYARFYSTERLRRLAERQRGTQHPDLWRALSLVMTHLGSDEGCPPLGLPALGSLLWSSRATPDLDRRELANRDLLDAIRALAFTIDGKVRRPVDYRNLGSEELGSIYEALLELHPEVNTDAATFELKTASGHERKTTGSYYTPSSLIQCLLDSALDPVLDEAARKPNPDAAILDLKVCDPACGSGHFLIAAAHRIAKRLGAVRTGDEEPSPEATRAALRDVISRCIYGVDVNEMAVELCKVSLWMEALEPGRPLSFLDHRIVCGNSLLGTTPTLLAGGIPDEAFTAIEGDDKAVVTALRKRNRSERDGQMTLPMVAEPGGEYALLTSAFAGLGMTGEESIEAVHAKEEWFEGLITSAGYQKAQLLADAWCAAFVWRKAENTVEPVTEDVLLTLGSHPDRVGPATRAEIARLARHCRFLHWHLAFPDVFRLPKPGETPNNAQAGWTGGFDVVLGNPPWERVKLQEKEWFATRQPEIAKAPNTAARRRKIAALREEDPQLWAGWVDASREAEGESHVVRNSGRYPLCGRGDINTYSIFAETNRLVLRPTGRVGCIVPTGIATDDTTKHFFRDLVDSQSLVSVMGFENEGFIFPAVHHATKFCLLTLSGRDRPQDAADFVFFARQVGDLEERHRHFVLTREDIALLNPNTRTCPIFRSKRDAELTKAIHHRVPVLIKEGPSEENPWGIRFLAMLHMANDSGAFRTREQLEADGWQLDGNLFRSRDETCLPLYEAKMVHHFDHRFGTYDGQTEAQANQGKLPELNEAQHADPGFAVLPRYWVPEKEVLLRAARIPEGLAQAYAAADAKMVAQFLTYWLAGYYLNRGNKDIGLDVIRRLFGSVFKDVTTAAMDQWLASNMAPALERQYPLTDEGRQVIADYADEFLLVARKLIEARCPRWFLGWRRICRSTDGRTFIAGAFPRVAVGDSLFLMLPALDLVPSGLGLATNLTTFVFDYMSRQKLGGTNMSYYIVEQLPVLSPSNYAAEAGWSPHETILRWLTPRVLELIYTARDLAPFARDCGYDGPPFRWEAERRFLLGCELESAFFHLYGIARDDVDYIMETFPIVKRDDVKRHGEYRTKRVILDIYDAMAVAIAAGTTYQTMLHPQPADPQVAHGPTAMNVRSAAP